VRLLQGGQISSELLHLIRSLVLQVGVLRGSWVASGSHPQSCPGSKVTLTRACRPHPARDSGALGLEGFLTVGGILSSRDRAHHTQACRRFSSAKPSLR